MVRFITILAYILYVFSLAMTTYTYIKDNKGYKNAEGVMIMVWYIKRHNTMDTLKNLLRFYMSYLVFQVFLIVFDMSAGSITINFASYYFGYYLAAYVLKKINPNKENKNVFWNRKHRY